MDSQSDASPSNREHDRVDSERLHEDPEAAGADLEEVRQLLFGTDRRHITRLEERLADPELQAQEVSRVLPRAILLRAQDDPALTRALSPLIESSIQISVKRNPRVLADAIFPVIGPAVRKSIASALGGMLERFNRALDESFSPRGIRWRLEAWRSSRPFGEVVLLHTLVFRVEQVFLIHRETSLLLQHVVAPAVPAQDPHLVSGMLSAIEDFARDSFAAGEAQPIDQMRLGDFTLMVEPGPQAFVAAAVRGSAPEDLRTRMQEALERIHREHSGILADFRGDAGAFELVRGDLEECLQERFHSRERRPSGLRKGLLAGGIVLVVAIAFVWIVRTVMARRDLEFRFANLVQAISEEPGYEILSAGLEGGRVRLVGLKDPLAREPAVLLSGVDLDPSGVLARWIPYESPASPIALARARDRLGAAAWVELSLSEGVLRARGSASNSWTARAEIQALAIPGVRAFDASELIDPDREEVEKRLRAIAAERLDFAPGEIRVSDPARIERLRENLMAADQAARAAGLVLHLRILGRSRGTTGELDVRAGREFAEAVRSALSTPWPRAVIVSAVGAADPDAGVEPHPGFDGVVTFSGSILEEDRVPETAR